MCIFMPLLFSVSTIACRQVPHGDIGSSSSPSAFLAAMAIASTFACGYCAPAANKALRSAHIVTPKAAFS